MSIRKTGSRPALSKSATAPKKKKKSGPGPMKLANAKKRAALALAPPKDLQTFAPPVSPAVAGLANFKRTKLSEVFDAMRSIGGGPTKARVLSTNLDAWNSRWEMLSNAKVSIDTQYFILEKDVFGFAFLGLLLEKQQSGVQVRLMTDAMADTFGKNGFKMPLRGKDYLQELVNHGAEAAIYHPIHDRPETLIMQGGFAPLASNHDKILIVDGLYSVTGGRNVAKDYFADPKDHKAAWRDMDVALEGEGTAKGMKAAFELEFDNENIAKRVHRDRLGNWDQRDIQLIGTAKMMDLWLKATAFSEAEKARLRADPAGRTALARELVEKALAALPEKQKARGASEVDREFLLVQAEELVQQLEARGSYIKFIMGGAMPNRDTQTKIIDQTSAANGRINGMANTLTDMVRAAKTRIVIENPYVVLTTAMLEEMQRAGERGVQIDIITNSPLSTDSKQTQAFFLEDWPLILARVPNARIFVATGDHKFHTKAAVVDGEDAFISTYNLDLLSGYVNSELGAVVKSQELARDLAEKLDEDVKDPENGFLEYTIERSADGKPVVVDGKPVIKFGPEHHLPADVLEDYKGRRKLWGHTLRNNFDLFAPLRLGGIDS